MINGLGALAMISNAHIEGSRLRLQGAISMLRGVVAMTHGKEPAEVTVDDMRQYGAWLFVVGRGQAGYLMSLAKLEGMPTELTRYVSCGDPSPCLRLDALKASLGRVELVRSHVMIVTAPEEADDARRHATRGLLSTNITHEVIGYNL